MSNQKYYTPSIEEFRFGFDYELFDDFWMKDNKYQELREIFMKKLEEELLNVSDPIEIWDDPNSGTFAVKIDQLMTGHGGLKMYIKAGGLIFNLKYNGVPVKKISEKLRELKIIE